jgi:hypothetical protein
MKRLLTTILFSLFAFAANATCPTVFPYILTNGQPADANQVMANYNAIQTSCAASGANSDITSLSGLTTPLSQAQGGTGSSTGLGIVPLSQERLTLTTGVPVLTNAVSAATVLYYTPYNGNNIPLFSVGGVAGVACAETNNTLSATTNAGPFAAASNAVYDMFEWNNAGVCTLTRGDMWQETATITVTIASPAVVTYTGHGLAAGAPIRFSTTGALPTGIIAGTTYYVIAAGIATNTFEFSTSVGGSAVNTSGSQSGVQTGVAGTGIKYLLNGAAVARGTAPAIARSSGLLTNSVSIPNGPTVGLGTYIGTIQTDSTGATVSWALNTSGSGGVAGSLNIWNMYNRIPTKATDIDTGAQYSYGVATVREARASAGNQINIVIGVAEEGITLSYPNTVISSAAENMFTGFGLDSITAFSTGCQAQDISLASALTWTMGPVCSLPPMLGGHYVAVLENVSAHTDFFDCNSTNQLGVELGM